MTYEYIDRVFLAPNTSDQEIIKKATEKLVENGVKREDIQINYNTNELEVGNLYVSYDPPHIVIRNVYEKKSSGLVKMKSIGMIDLD